MSLKPYLITLEELPDSRKKAVLTKKFIFHHLLIGLMQLLNLALHKLSLSYTSLYRSIHFLAALHDEKLITLLELERKKSKTKVEIIAQQFRLQTVRAQT